MINDYFWLAFRSIRNRKLRSWLTMIGIFIGVASVVALISLGQGMQDAINKEFSTFGVDKFIIQGKSAGFGPPGSFSAGKLTDKDLELVQKTKGVEIATSRIIKTGSIGFGDEQQARGIVSMPEDKHEAQLIIDGNNYKIIEGRMIKPADKDKVIVGYNFRHGKLFEKPVRPGNKLMINGEQFEVVGIIGKQGDPYTDRAVLMNHGKMDELFTLGGEISLIYAQVQNGQDINKVTADVEKELRKKRNQKEGKEDFEVQTPQQFMESINSILGIVQAVVIGIAAISIIVGGIGIMNTMYTSVIERTKEIGIMKATGARNGHILALFLAESGIIGMTGGAIGVVIGVGIGKIVEAAAQQALGSSLLQASFSWPLITGALAFSFIIGTVSGALPAMQASKLKPVDALRFE